MFGSSVLAHLLILELLTQIATTNIAWSWRWWNERAGSNETVSHSRKTWWVYMESLGLSKEDTQARNKWRRQIKGASTWPGFTWINGH